MAETPVTTTKSKQPGPLRSNSHLVLHTRQAQRLVEGRSEAGRPPIFGMLSFGRKLRAIWISGEHNDPYADWYLLQIETAIGAAHELLQTHTAEVSGRLSGMSSVHIDVATSMEPIEVPLSFANPYGYMGAYLVADFDELARKVFTARHVGLIDRKFAEALLHQCGNAVRRAFQLAVQWHYTGVTRDDVRQGTALAQKAKALMGDVPEEHQSLSLRAKCAPIIRTTDPRQDPLGLSDEDPVLGYGYGPVSATASVPPAGQENRKPKPKSVAA